MVSTKELSVLAGVLALSLGAGFVAGEHSGDFGNDITESIDSIYTDYTSQDITDRSYDSSQGVHIPKHGTGGYQYPPNADTDFVGQMKPNTTTMADGYGVPPYKVRINHEGFRDEKFPKTENPHTIRVAVIGGSITFGKGVNETDRYTERLERKLNDNSETDYEVVNMGTSGLGMEDFESILRKKMSALHPDVVVVAVSGGDTMSHERVLEIHRNALRGLEIPDNASRSEAESIRQEAKIEAQREVGKEIANDPEKLKNSLGEPMNDIADLAMEERAQLVFYKVSPTRDPISEFLRKWSDENSIPVYEAPDTFLENIRSTKYSISEVDHHPNPYGHEVLAEELYNSLDFNPKTVVDCFQDGGLICEERDIVSRPEVCKEWWQNPNEHECRHTTEGVQNISHISNPANYITGNFTDEDYTVEHIPKQRFDPWDLEFFPNGTPVVTDDRGKIFMIQNDRYQEITEIPVVHNRKAGLMGLAIHPNFEETQYIYLYYTFAPEVEVMEETGNTMNRLERFRLENGELIDSKTLLEQEGGKILNGGRIEFGPDDKLYITTGNAYNKTASQSLEDRRGKILRMNPDGTVPEDNPFEGKYIYSYGHRNPQGIAWYPEHQDLFNSEHGGWRHGEINQVEPGENYGFGVKECDRTRSASGTILERNRTEFHLPLRCYKNWTIAPSGMAIVDDENHPWYGNIFQAGLRSKHVRMIELEVSEGSEEYGKRYSIEDEEVFWVNTEGSSRRLRDVEYHNGSIWVLPNYNGGVYKLTPEKYEE